MVAHHICYIFFLSPNSKLEFLYDSNGSLIQINDDYWVILQYNGRYSNVAGRFPVAFFSAQPAVQVWINLRIAGQSHQAGHIWGRARLVDVGIFLGQKIGCFSGFVGMIANE
jgi:hypothetical protein